MGDSDVKPESAKDLLDRYRTLGIPHFQRGLVWNDDATSLLLESLYWNTPCGIIILWEPQKPVEYGKPLEGDACERLIVDGQQRIRMLHDAFQNGTWGVGEVDDKREWCLDLMALPSFTGLIKRDDRRTRLFVLTKPYDRKNTRYQQGLVPLSIMTDDAAGGNICKINLTPDVVQIEAARLASLKRLRGMMDNKAFAIRILREDETDNRIGDVVSLYNRINSAGRRVEAEEIAYATLVRIFPQTTSHLARFLQKKNWSNKSGLRSLVAGSENWR